MRIQSMALLVLLGCDAVEAPVEPNADLESELYGGFPARSPRFAAVGSIVELISDANGGDIQAKCSGTLIGPHTVLTSAHCVEKYKGKDSALYTEMWFRLGYDSASPERQIRIIGTRVGPQYSGSLTGRGSDLALAYLAEDVDDITPIAVSSDPLTDADVGRTFFIVGYGQQHFTDPIGQHRPRQFGTNRLAALSGDPKPAVFGSLEGLVDWIHDNLNVSASTTALAGFWSNSSHVLLEGQVAYFSAAQNGAQSCMTDGGGPLLRTRNGQLEIVATASGLYQLTINGQRICFGGTYAGLVANEVNNQFIHGFIGDRCRGIPETSSTSPAVGVCRGDSAYECAAFDDDAPNVPPISGVDCSELGMWCGRDETGAATCLDPFTPTVTPTSSCTLVGGNFQRPDRTAFSFRTDGVYAIRGAPVGTYRYADGALELEDTSGLCLGSTPGVFTVSWSPSCSNATIRVVHDGCRLRGEGFELTPLTRVP